MSCDRTAERISDLVDGTLEETTRTQIEAHLESCPSCRALAADLGRIREAAGALPPQRPPARVWQQLAERLPAAAPSPPGTDVDAAFAWNRSLGWLAAAASVVLVAGSAYWLVPTMSSTGSGANTSTAADATAVVESIESELEAAEAHYQNAIAGLEQIAQAERETLGPGVAAELQLSMTVLDDAIAESRAALVTEPESQSAQSSLFEALRRKVSLLQDTISLVNEMRKGDAVEAGRIVGELNQS